MPGLKLAWEKVDSLNPISVQIELPKYPKSDSVFHIRQGKEVSGSSIFSPVAFFRLSMPMSFFSEAISLTNEKLKKESIRLTNIDEQMAVLAVRFYSCFYNHVPVAFILLDPLFAQFFVLSDRSILWQKRVQKLWLQYFGFTGFFQTCWTHIQ